MPNSNYSKLLKNPRWQKKRLKVMERDKFMCALCKSKVKTLNVHHKHYERGKKPWEYEDDNLITLCQNCHQDTHYNNAVLATLAKFIMDTEIETDESPSELGGI